MHEAESKTITAALAPAQIVNVRVTYADTGQPVPHAPLRVMASQGRAGRLDESETDGDGRARINSWPADRSYGITAYPPEGQPYLIASGQSRVAQGRPRAGPRHRPAARRAGPRQGHRGGLRPAGRGGAGGFRHPSRADRPGSEHRPSIPVPTARSSLGAEPGPGYLFVRAPDDDYVFQAIGTRMVLDGQPGGTRMYTHAYAVLDLKPGIGSQEVNLVAPPRGDGDKAGSSGPMASPSGMPGSSAGSSSTRAVAASNTWSGRYHGKVPNGRFEVGGLDPDAEVPVYFLEPERKLGAVVNLSARSAAGGPVTVRLEPCGAARAWLVDPDGKPVVKPRART